MCNFDPSAYDTPPARVREGRSAGGQRSWPPFSKAAVSRICGIQELFLFQGTRLGPPLVRGELESQIGPGGRRFILWGRSRCRELPQSSSPCLPFNCFFFRPQLRPRGGQVGKDLAGALLCWVLSRLPPALLGGRSSLLLVSAAPWAPKAVSTHHHHHHHPACQDRPGRTRERGISFQSLTSFSLGGPQSPLPERGYLPGGTSAGIRLCHPGGAPGRSLWTHSHLNSRPQEAAEGPSELLKDGERRSGPGSAIETPREAEGLASCSGSSPTLHPELGNQVLSLAAWCPPTRSLCPLTLVWAAKILKFILGRHTKLSCRFSERNTEKTNKCRRNRFAKKDIRLAGGVCNLVEWTRQSLNNRPPPPLPLPVSAPGPTCLHSTYSYAASSDLHPRPLSASAETPQEPGLGPASAVCAAHESGPQDHSSVLPQGSPGTQNQNTLL